MFDDVSRISCTYMCMKNDLDQYQHLLCTASIKKDGHKSVKDNVQKIDN